MWKIAVGMARHHLIKRIKRKEGCKVTCKVQNNGETAGYTRLNIEIEHIEENRGGEEGKEERSIPFKVKIESRLCVLRFRQFSRNITRRGGITARS